MRNLVGVLTKDADEDGRKKKADETANNDFTRAVADTFFKSGELDGGKLEGLNERIQVAALIAEVHTEPNSIVDDEKSDSDCNGESAGADTFVVADRSEERDRERGVSTWHVAMSCDVFEPPAMFQTVHDKLHELGDEAHDNWDEEDGVGLKELFGSHDASIPYAVSRSERLLLSLMRHSAIIRLQKYLILPLC